MSKPLITPVKDHSAPAFTYCPHALHWAWNQGKGDWPSLYATGDQQLERGYLPGGQRNMLVDTSAERIQLKSKTRVRRTLCNEYPVWDTLVPLSILFFCQENVSKNGVIPQNANILIATLWFLYAYLVKSRKSKLKNDSFLQVRQYRRWWRMNGTAHALTWPSLALQQ